MHRRLTRLPLRDVAALAFLALVWLLLYWRFLPITPVAADRVMLSDGDFWQTFYTYRSFAFSELRAGRPPLWLPCVFSGYPYQADPQSALFYPSTVVDLGVWLALGAQQLPRDALQFESLVHVLLGAWFMYAFLRGEVRRRTAALTGALVFGFGGYLTGYPPLQLAILQTAVWLPLALLCLRRIITLRRWRDTALLGLVWGVSLLAGHPQTFMLVLYASLAYAAWRTISAHGLRSRESLRVGAGVALALLLAAGLAAVQWLPSLEYAGLSTRAEITFEQAGTGLPLQDVLQFVVPGFVSLWQPLYVGLFPLALAGFAVFVWRRGTHSAVLFWLGLGLAGLILAFGKHVLGYDLAYLILPGYRLFRSQERHAIWVALACAALAAHGADCWLAPLSRRMRVMARRAGVALGAAAVMLFVALAVVTYLKRAGYDPSDSGRLPQHVGLAFLIIALCAVLWASRLRGLRRDAAAVLLLGLVTFDLLSTAEGVNAEKIKPLYAPSPLVRAVLDDQPAGPYRVQDDSILTGHLLCSQGISELGGASPIRPAGYAQFIQRAPEAVRWKVLNVHYLVTWRGEVVTREGQTVAAEQLYAQGQGKDFQATYRFAAVPRAAWLVHQAQDVADDDALFAALSAPGFDPFATAVLVEPHGAWGAVQGASERVILEERLPGRIVLDAVAQAPGLVVVSEAAYPGWTALVDGEARPVLTVDGVVQGVEVPAGTHRVVLEYRPRWLLLGVALSAAALLVAVAGLVMGGPRRQGR